jgi:hypothetical protein
MNKQITIALVKSNKSTVGKQETYLDFYQALGG